VKRKTYASAVLFGGALAAKTKIFSITFGFEAGVCCKSSHSSQRKSCEVARRRSRTTAYSI
jgi:hypothetical protein